MLGTCVGAQCTGIVPNVASAGLKHDNDAYIFSTTKDNVQVSPAERSEYMEDGYGDGCDHVRRFPNSEGTGDSLMSGGHVTISQ